MPNGWTNSPCPPSEQQSEDDSPLAGFQGVPNGWGPPPPAGGPTTPKPRKVRWKAARYRLSRAANARIKAGKARRSSSYSGSGEAEGAEGEESDDGRRE
jgi:hypothetical protein